jgi:hypothetical protein
MADHDAATTSASRRFTRLRPSISCNFFDDAMRVVLRSARLHPRFVGSNLCFPDHFPKNSFLGENDSKIRHTTIPEPAPDADAITN